MTHSFQDPYGLTLYDKNKKKKKLIVSFGSKKIFWWPMTLSFQDLYV